MTKFEIIDGIELEQRAAVEAERKMWEDIIFRVAKRVGVPTKGLSAGEVVTAMGNHIEEQSNQIARLLKEVRSALGD